MTNIKSLLIGLAMALCASAVWAEKTIEAGRLKLVFNEDAWEASEELPYNRELNSAQGTFRGKSRVLTLRGANATPLAVMYVAATYGQTNVYTSKGKCGADARIYIRDLNEDRFENYRCLFVGGPYEASSLLKGDAVPYLKEASGKVSVAAPAGTAFFVATHLTAHGGLQIHIEVLAAAGFSGLADRKPAVDSPALLRSGVAAWGDALAEAAVKALTSFSGTLNIPPAEFR